MKSFVPPMVNAPPFNRALNYNGRSPPNWQFFMCLLFLYRSRPRPFHGEIRRNLTVIRLIPLNMLKIRSLKYVQQAQINALNAARQNA